MADTLCHNLTGLTAPAITHLLYVDTGTLDRKLTIQALLGRYDLKGDFGAVGDGATDDTAAIQSAFNAAITNNIPLFVPAGIYLIAGALTDTGDSNCQVKIKTIDNLSLFGQTTQQPTLSVFGPTPPPTSGESTVLPTTGYAVFKSTLTGGSGTASVFSGQVGRNNVHIHLENLILDLPANPSLTGWNLGSQNDCIVKHLLVHAEHLVIASVTQPTNAGQVGIVLPQNNHPANVMLQNCMVWGCYTGYKTGECGYMISGMNAESCINGVMIPFTYHANIFHSIGIYECANGLVSDGSGAAYFTVGLLDFENAASSYNAWQRTTGAGGTNPGSYHINDSGNFLHANIRDCHQVDAGVGVTHTAVLKNGGSNCTVTDMA